MNLLAQGTDTGDERHEEVPRFTQIVGKQFARALAITIAVACVCCCCVTSVHADAMADEYRLKAAFLFHFAQLVEWPADATMSNSDDPFVFCVFGDDPFGGELEKTLENKRIGARSLRVRHPRHTRELAGCQLLFISHDESRHTANVINEVRNTPVLTVGESDDFLHNGGIIRFCWEGNKLRFDISRTAGEAARLKISSRLLMLAKSVG